MKTVFNINIFFLLAPYLWYSPTGPEERKGLKVGLPPSPFSDLEAPKEIGSGPILHDPLHFPIPTQKEERRGGSETFPEGQGEAHRIPTFYGEAERRKFKAIFRGRGLLGGEKVFRPLLAALDSSSGK